MRPVAAHAKAAGTFVPAALLFRGLLLLSLLLLFRGLRA
mgnify:CR=1 FL=1